MKITIKNIINENIDITPEEKYINVIFNMITPPYFYFLEVNEVPRELWNDIFSNIFNRIVTYGNNKMFDSNNNVIYFENSDGNWVKREYDKNNNVIYFEDSIGYWWKQEFDSNNNQIYYENSDGNWVKKEYDSNNNQIYYEDSIGYWRKHEFDKNNNPIYYENSDGYIMDNRSISSINENITPEEKYINVIFNMIRTPYFYNLRVNEVPRELWNDILSKVFNTKVTYRNNRMFDKNNNQIYYEDSIGYWRKHEFDKNNNPIYYENSDGYWWKYEFDKNNNPSYYENSDGYWEKKEYDKNNNRIYYENSDGDIMDNRPSNPINENIDPKQKFLSLVVDNMVKQSKDNWFPFDSQKMSFNEYCKNVYGLTDDEINYVFRKYRFLMGWDEWDRSLPYLKKLI